MQATTKKPRELLIELLLRGFRIESVYGTEITLTRKGYFVSIDVEKGTVVYLDLPDDAKELIRDFLSS